MKYIKTIISLGIAAALMFTAGCSRADVLKCNFGTADITPDGNVVLAGFAARKGLSTTVHRPLKTRCLVIGDGAQKVCIVSNDLMELPIALADTLRDRISAGTGIPRSHIFIHCIHTHSAPRVSGNCAKEGGTNHAYVHKLLQTVTANAVATANDSGSFVPFGIELGKGECLMNCNRREKDVPCDHDLYCARLTDKKGKPIVSMLNYACHPVSLNHQSLVVSTDFPGIAVDEVTKAWGGAAVYFTGAAGNVDPCGPLRSDTLYTQSRGMELAEAAKNITFSKMNAGNALRVFNMEIELPFRAAEITPETIEAHVAEITEWSVSETWKDDVAGWRDLILGRIAAGEVKNYLPFEVAAVNIGGLVLFFSQGEPFNEYQTALRVEFPNVPILFIAYTNGQNSYLPDRHAYLSDAYEYEKEQMHIYIKSPYPLSGTVPEVYESACRETVEAVLVN